MHTEAKISSSSKLSHSRDGTQLNANYQEYLPYQTHSKQVSK
jgi:hypothetical protein